MSSRQACARFELRSFLGSWDWVWFAMLAVVCFAVGRLLSFEFAVWGLFMVFVMSNIRYSARRGDTGFSSMGAYLVSRPVGRVTVFRWRRVVDLVWAGAFLVVFGLGLWLDAVDRVEPPPLMSLEPPVPSRANAAWLFVLGVLGASTLAETVSPFLRVSSPRRTIGDSIFIGLAWLGFAAVFTAYFVLQYEESEPPSSTQSRAVLAVACAAAFIAWQAPRIWRRYDFVTSRDQGGGGLGRFLLGVDRPATAWRGRGSVDLSTWVFLYPPLAWFVFEGARMWFGPHTDGSVWPSPGLGWMLGTVVCVAIVGTYTWSFYYSQGPVAAYALSRPAPRKELARTNGTAFGLGGLVVVGLLAAAALYTEGHFDRGALLLPWAWLIFLTAGTVAMAASLASPTFNSPVGLMAAIVLISTTAAAILVKKPPEGWNTPLGAAFCLATAFTLGALVIIVADRHVRTADIG